MHMMSRPLQNRRYLLRMRGSVLVVGPEGCDIAEEARSHNETFVKRGTMKTCHGPF